MRLRLIPSFLAFVVFAFASLSTSAVRRPISESSNMGPGGTVTCLDNFDFNSSIVARAPVS